MRPRCGVRVCSYFYFLSHHVFSPRMRGASGSFLRQGATVLFQLLYCAAGCLPCIFTDAQSQQVKATFFLMEKLSPLR